MTNDADFRDEEHVSTAMTALSAVFDSFGRVLLCLDREFRIVHVSAGREELLGKETREAVIGSPVAVLLGDTLFAPGAPLRQALERGERREGWRAAITAPDGSSRFVSCSVAAFRPDRDGVCDPNIAFVIILRPAEEDMFAGTGSPVGFAGMVARSPQMVRLFELAQSLRTSDAPILITGECGVGKEVLARAIHATSSRGGGRFVVTNCGSLPAEMLEIEMFGQAGARDDVGDRVGRIELARGGTWLLEGIGALSLQLQLKLLRVLEEKRFTRVGERESRAADARIIASSTVDLRNAIGEGKFREDLYYRLRVVPIEVPPLRERREDIEPLARLLLDRVASRHGRELRFSPDAVRALFRHSWPGNVRELENAIEYAVTVARGEILHPEDLPGEVFDRTALIASDRAGLSGTPQGAAAREADVLRKALEKHRWQREATARALGISRTTLWRKMREAGLNELDAGQRDLR